MFDSYCERIGRDSSTRLRIAPATGALLVIILCASCTEPPSASGPPAPELPKASADALSVADWPRYNRDLRGTRYSPLADIDTRNVADLRLIWSYALGANTTTGGFYGGSELTPLVVDGTLFLAAADRVVALDASRGRERWRHAVADGAPSRRGVAYWPGQPDIPARLFFTNGRRLVALEAASGRRAAGFGVDGEIEMPVVYNAAPTLFEHLLIVGSNTAPGGVRAYDARTGVMVWTFESVPRVGEHGASTWEKRDSGDEPSVLHWAFAFTVDVDRAILYAAFAGPGPNADYGGTRPGDNLFANSVVALDARTGRRIWHFQTVHHDLWDYDLPAPPTLLDVTIGGRRVPLLAQPGKTGYLYVLNRVTGEPVFGIEERPVPQSGVPGERTSPTQPIPLKPPALARVSYAEADLVTERDTTAEHAEFCRALRERSGGLQNSGPFTPYGYRAPGSRARSTVVFPGSLGGANWGGAAVDPNLGYVFVNTADAGGIGWLEPAPPRGDAELAATYRRASAVGGPLARFWANDAPSDSGGNEVGGGELAWPCQKPPWGRLTAVDAASGEIVWQVPLGITEQLPEGKQRTGRLNVGGPIATAGGLVFIGATNDRRFRAFDSRTGEELWSTELSLSAHAVPITYRSNGRQFVAIVAAGAAAIDNSDARAAQALLVYALP